VRQRGVTLVSQYLEKISGEALEEYQAIFRDIARRRNGVYALYRKDRLYYVGLARDLRGRLKTHLRDRHSRRWDRFSIYLTIGDDHTRELESLVMRIAQPAGNRQLGKFPRAQNLRREFAKRIRDLNKYHLDFMLGRQSPKVAASKKRRRKKGQPRQPVMSRWISKPLKLRATFKDRVLKARVRRDGRITFRRETFNSPSIAARRAIGRKRAVNGWSFWLYERAPGDWAKLNELRN